MGFADLHIHTIHSYDGTASVRDVLRRARRVGLDVICITDHDEIAGALNAVALAPHYGLEAIPGIEITTADGDLLALCITEKVPAALPVIETILRVRELGGICIVPHLAAGGFSMKSLTAQRVLEALENPQVAETLIAIETFNATSIDRTSNHHARMLARQVDLARTGNSDAHILDTIGFGATEFRGHTAADLLLALRNRRTQVYKAAEWTPFQVLSTWGLQFIGSRFARLAGATA